MTTNLLPISSDGGFVTGGNITTSSHASPAPTLSGFSSLSSDNIILQQGNIVGGVATIVDDGINSIALAPGAQMDVYGFPFSQTTRGQLTISGVTTPAEVNGTWYYQSVSTNAYQIYTDNTYTTLVDTTGWSAYTGGGVVAIAKQVPAANIVINSNGFLTKFANDGNVTLPGSATVNGDLIVMSNLDMTGGTISNISNASGNNANFAHFSGEGGNLSNIQGANVSGEVAYASTANSVAVANVSGIGNIATVNLTGSSSNVLYGNGVFAAAAGGSSSNIANGNSNVNIATANGNVTIAAVGNTVMTVTGTGANITGTANISGNVALANLSFSANTGQIVFNTTAYINGSGNSIGRDGSIMLVPYTGAGSTFPGVVIGGAGRLIAPNGSVHQVFNTSDVTFQVPVKNIVGTAATSTTTGSLQITGGGGFTGNVYVGGSIVRTGAISNNAWTTSGIGLKIPTSIYTDNSTAAGTQASSYVNVMDAPTLSFSNAVTVTNAATMFVAAPTAGTNATITNSYAMIANGAVQINGNLTANTNGFAIGYLNIPQVSASNTTLAATDAGKHYYSTTAGNFTLTIPNNATTSFATGTAISIVVQAAGNILVNAASGVTLYMAGNSTAANRVVGGYGMATLMKVASDTWFINGTGVS